MLNDLAEAIRRWTEKNTDGSKKKDCLIALNEDTRICWADQETFATGFEDKYDMRPTAHKGAMSYGKRKHPRDKALPNLSMLQVPIVPETCKL